MPGRGGQPHRTTRTGSGHPDGTCDYPMSPHTGRRIHLALLTGWLIIGLPISYLLRHSLTWIVALSVYAIVVGHWSGWSAERPSEVVEQ